MSPENLPIPFEPVSGYERSYTGRRRISNGNPRFNESHPIIIPVQSRYAELLIEFTHILLLHAENNLLLRSIREEYYISKLRSAIKKCIRRCKICVIYKRKTQAQLMAPLPQERSSYSLPFTITGLDFAGPFSIKTSTRRNAVYQKGYLHSQDLLAEEGCRGK
ncbi:uncharacterized protein LOC142239874 [Haematobia irritans]|uniref:uncharacterized protein LOC142239874 n=1 Tax=Haematobia irritans TaxID=7368 RepID=UPI003F5091B7